MNINNDMTLKQYRNYLGLTQAKFALKIDCAQQHVQRFESGKNHPSVNTLIKISNTFHCTVIIKPGYDTVRIKIKLRQSQ